MGTSLAYIDLGDGGVGRTASGGLRRALAVIKFVGSGFAIRALSRSVTVHGVAVDLVDEAENNDEDEGEEQQDGTMLKHGSVVTVGPRAFNFYTAEGAINKGSK